MSIRSSLRNAKHELRWVLYGGLGPLAQKFYEGDGFRSLDGGKLEDFLGEESHLPGIAAVAGAIWASYKAGKAIDGKWFKPLRGSVQTLAYGGLVAATLAAGAYANSEVNSDSINYVSEATGNLKQTLSVFSNGEMAPLLYTTLAGGFLSGAARWVKNAGSYLVELGAGKPGPTDDYKKEENKGQR